MISGITIEGIQHAQEANLRHIAAMQPNGALGRAVQFGTIEAHRYAVAITHVDTGALRASHRMAVSGNHGRIYVDPTTVNPRTGERPAAYALEEHARGGSHAFYARTDAEAGYRIGEAAGRGFAQDFRP